MVVIDASFDDLTNVLTSLGVLELGQQSYLIILVCSSIADECISSQQAANLVKSSKIVVVSSCWKHGYQNTPERFVKLFFLLAVLALDPGLEDEAAETCKSERQIPKCKMM